MPGLGRVSLWAKICQCAHRCSFCQGKFKRVLGASTHPLMEQENIKVAIVAPPKLNTSCIKAQRVPLLCVDGRLAATISRSSSATVPSRWPAATRRAGFYGAPRRSHLSCDHLCLPPAIGQGSYNRRVGGPAPVEDGTAAKQVWRRYGAGISNCRGKT